MKTLLIPLATLVILQINLTGCGGGSTENTPTDEPTNVVTNSPTDTPTSNPENDNDDSSVSDEPTNNPMDTSTIPNSSIDNNDTSSATNEPINNNLSDTSTSNPSNDNNLSSVSDEPINNPTDTSTTPNSSIDTNDTSSIPNDTNLQIISSKHEASRFLNQATFGASSAEVQIIKGSTRSSWLLNEFDKNISYNLPLIAKYKENIESGAQTAAFWKNAISGDDQLRQKMAYALSQIFVVSDATNEELSMAGAMGYYVDILLRNAFGNYRDLLEEVTYSPAMGYYLTYMNNEKSNPETGQRPDENYAREVMQLFSIGLLELNIDGTVKTDKSGNAIETYTNDDIKGLAKVFTGLVLDKDKVIYLGEDEDPELRYNVEPAWMTSMIIDNEIHSLQEKTFLNYTIPANTQTAQSIKLALDHLATHDNVAPFISRQLIQRFTTSHPSSAYVERVATVFKLGSYTLEDGTKVGTGKHGDLKATLAAILLDEEAISPSNPNSFGKIKEPILRFTQWSRAFELKEIAPEYVEILYDTSLSSLLNQHPYRSPSVFNFYRPGYIAPKTMSGNANMTAPELQITNATSIVGYSNFMSYFIFGWGRDINDIEESKEGFITGFKQDTFLNSFKPTYTTEIALAEKPTELIEHLNTLLCDGRLQEGTKQNIIETISYLPTSTQEDKFYRVGFAIFMVVNSPEFMVQS